MTNLLISCSVQFFVNSTILILPSFWRASSRRRLGIEETVRSLSLRWTNVRRTGRSPRCLDAVFVLAWAVHLCSCSEASISVSINSISPLEFELWSFDILKSNKSNEQWTRVFHEDWQKVALIELSSDGEWVQEKSRKSSPLRPEHPAGATWRFVIMKC